MKNSVRVLVCAGLTALALVAASRQSVAASGSYPNLQLSAQSAWKLYTEGSTGYTINVEQPPKTVADTTAPSGVGSTVFDFHIFSSTQYANAYWYQNLGQVSSNSFEYTMWYRLLPNGAIAQAYEFPLNKYTGGYRYQIAVQYEPNHDGLGYRWRVWGGVNGGKWRDTNPNTGQSWGFTQNLSTGTWHSMALYGSFDTTNHRVNYTDFWSDGIHFPINAGFPADVDTGHTERIVPAYQVDNTPTGNEQHVHISNWSVLWF